MSQIWDTVFRGGIWGGGGFSLTPDFVLNFLNGGSVPNSLLSVSRTGATYTINNAGLLVPVADNTARLKFDPQTKRSRGLTVERAVTNLVSNSEDFTNASWTKAGCTISGNVTTDPYGTLLADKIVEDNTTTRHQIRVQPAITANTIYTGVIALKAAERTKATVLLRDTAESTGGTMSVDLTNGQITSSSVTGTGTDFLFYVEPWVDGWYLCYVSGVIDATSTTARFLFCPNNAANAATYLGDSVSGIYCFGGQVYAGRPVSYCPTTRTVENVTISDALVASLFSGPAVTVYTESVSLTPYNGVSAEIALTARNSGGITERHSLAHVRQSTDGRGQGSTVAGGATIASLVPTGAYTIGAKRRIAYAAKQDRFNCAIDGVLGTEDTSGAMPTAINQLVLGSLAGTSNLLDGELQVVAIFKRYLEPDKLRQLSLVGVT